MAADSHSRDSPGRCAVRSYEKETVAGAEPSGMAGWMKCRGVGVALPRFPAENDATADEAEGPLPPDDRLATTRGHPDEVVDMSRDGEIDIAREMLARARR